MSTGHHPSTGDVTVVVLAGGTSRRFGSDKLDARFHGSTVLQTVVGSLPEQLAGGRRGAGAGLRPNGHVDP